MAVKSELYILTWDKESDRRGILRRGQHDKACRPDERRKEGSGIRREVRKDPVSEEEKYINGI
jgi:hypothetical protein